MKKLMLRYSQIKIAVLIWLFRIIWPFQKKKYWVMFERGTDARDNAYFFYKFLKEKHPEIKLYYIIDKNSADFGKVKEDAVFFGSIKNYWVLAHAEKIVSTHYYFGAPNMNKKIFDFCKLYKNFYYLQHGITMNCLRHYHYDVAPMKLFICGAKAEYDYIKKAYGFPESVARYTGFARYDSLHSGKTKNQILVMPTWRRNLTDRELFKGSDYFYNWQKLLTDKNLISLLNKNNIELVFYPHYEMQKYASEFVTVSDKVKIATFEEYDVQTLLKESKLFITDYSSVFFDFAYMEKPVIYFQFDKDAFYENHYEKGYFDFEEMGFGKICTSSDEIVNQTENYIETSFCIEDVFKKRVNEFFVFRDKNNCERIYDAIMKR